MLKLKQKNLLKINRDYIPHIEKYIEKVYSFFKKDLLGVIIYGSLARGTAKSLQSLESDVDMLVIIKGLSDWKNRAEQKGNIDRDVRFGIEAFWLTPEDLDGYFKAKTGFILDAFYEGIIVYDPQQYLEKKRKELFLQLKQKGVRRVEWGWLFPIKAGQKIEY